MIKVMAINGSARMAKGYTERLLSPFLDGMKEAGASVEKFYTKRLQIKPCTGTFYCWYQKPGICTLKDDMETIYPKLKEANILVLATPVYLPLPGEMQNFLNRICPLVEPILSSTNGRTRAKFRDDVMIDKIVLVSASGWWERGNFDTLLRIVKELAKDVNTEFAGALLRPHAFIIDENPDKEKVIYDACKQVGNQLITRGRMSSQLLRIISQPLIAEEILRSRYNATCQSVSEKAV